MVRVAFTMGGSRNFRHSPLCRALSVVAVALALVSGNDHLVIPSLAVVAMPAAETADASESSTQDLVQDYCRIRREVSSEVDLRWTSEPIAVSERPTNSRITRNLARVVSVQPDDLRCEHAPQLALRARSPG